MKKHLVDSSVFVAFFADFDIHHDEAVRLLSSLRGTLLVPYCVINETAAVLTYKHSKEQADVFVRFVLATHEIMTLTDDMEEEVRAFLAVSVRMSFTDIALAHLTHKYSARLHTFDKQLDRFVRSM